MTYYLLPKTASDTYKYINTTLKNMNEDCELFISHSLSYYLNNIKEQITDIEHEWDIIKRYTNPYEFIHTNIPDKNKCVAKYKPLSRSYFKMIEIIKLFNIDELYKERNIKSFHLAEGPGGFIEALIHIRNNSNDKLYGMTIIDNNNNNYNIPSWKKSQQFLKKNKNVIIENGSTGTGDLLNVSNLEYCYEKYKHSMDIITGDGGFDFSENFNKQEINIVNLLYSQICYALAMQSHGGCFILKIFDCFRANTVDLIYLLSSFYSKVYIIKPHTSRYGNSEKYIVCKFFLFGNNDNNDKDIFQYIYKSLKLITNSNGYIHRLLNINIPTYFLNKLQEYNAIFGQQQLENIAYTISLIKNNDKDTKKQHMIKTNTIKCIHWCEKYDVSTNIIPGLLMLS